MITIESILMNRAKFDSLPVEMKNNVKKLHIALFDLETSWGKPFEITSGLRLPANNAAAGGATKSAHLTCEACDIADLDGKLWQWVLQNLELVAAYGLYVEDKRWCKGWCHFQIRRPASGSRIFKAYSTPPPHPELWDGKIPSAVVSK